jgi:hypothetical protein
MAVKIIKDKECIYETENYDVVLVGVSTHNMLMGGFQGKMGVKYPIVKKTYESTPYGDLRKLGKRITFDDLTPIISLMFICKYPSRKNTFIDYEALENCLKTANAEFKGKKVMTTLVGSTRFDGKGDRDKCLKLLTECCKDLDLYIYDYEQITIREEYDRQVKYFKKLKDQYKDDNEMLEKIKEMSIEMKKKCFLPLTRSKGRSRNRTDDDILNI